LYGDGDHRDEPKERKLYVVNWRTGARWGLPVDYSVHRLDIIGRGAIIVFSIDRNANIWEPWRWPLEVRWSRLFNRVR